jgi:small-conductance mechanosensitive channel
VPPPVVVAPKSSSGSGSTGRPATQRPSSGPKVDPNKAQRDAEARANQRQLEAEARAKAERDAEKKKTGQRYLEQAGNLEAQAASLQAALNGSFKAGLDIKLANVGKTLDEQMRMLKEGHGLRSQSLLDTAEDSETAVSGEQNQGLSNMVRERQDAMSAILEQGAGETDAARAMLMSARNWNANAAEANRGYFDSIRSVNQGITDLNVDTKTGMTNAFLQSEGEKGRLWQDYYNQRVETLTQLGNIRGQQGSYYAQAKEMGVDPGARAAEVQAEMAAQYNAATDEAGKVYAQQALPGEIKDWEGAALKKGKQSNTNLAAATTIGPAQKAEGASLRRWKG